jgi:uncharacterized protein YndB with AHSA1/START domain
MDRSCIELSVLISASPSQVWSCLTDLAKINQWWSSRVYLEPCLGGKFEETWENEQGQIVLTKGNVLSLIPPQELRLSCSDEDWDIDTEVDFLLTSMKDKTQLSLFHKGWDAFSDEIGKTLQTHHQEGWLELLQGLKRLAETSDIQA